MQEKSESLGSVGFVERILPKKSIRRGLFYISTSLSGLWFVGAQLTEQGTDQVRGEISQTGQELGVRLDEKIDPTTKDLDEFMLKANGFFDDYQQFRLDICTSALGMQMEGCVKVLEDAGVENPNADIDLHTTTSTTTP